MEEVFGSLTEFFIFVLNVCNIVIAYSCCFIVNPVKHVACLSQVNNGQCVSLGHEVVIFELFGGYKITKLAVKICEFL